MAENELGELRRRVKRLEAFVALMVADPDLDKDYPYELLLQYLDSLESEYGFRDFLREFLYRLPRRSQLRERVARMEDRIGLLSDTIESNSPEQIKANLDSLAKETHGFIALQSMGIPLNQVRMTRFFPVRFYSSEDNIQVVNGVSNALSDVLKAFGFQFSDSFPAETGSWWKPWIAKTTDIVTSDEFQKRLHKLERAAEMKGLQTPQAENDVKQAEAVERLAKSLADIDNAAMQCGSVLMVKLTDSNGRKALHVRTLTQAELIAIENNQDLLKEPGEVLQRLKELCAESGTPGRTPVPARIE